MKKIDLLSLESNVLSRKEEEMVNGGNYCTCGCQYQNSGGSSTNDNMDANYQGDLRTKARTAAVMMDLWEVNP